jgi:anti-anti-sigma factor
VLVSGELDTASVGHLHEVLTLALRTRRRPRVEVDLRDVTFLDSAGLSVLLAASENARAGKGALWVANPPAQLRRLLAADSRDILQVRPQLEVVDSDSGADP